MKIVLFKGIRNLMLADKACKAAGIEVKVMPVPHQYSTECGMSLIVSDETLNEFLKIVSKLNLEIELINQDVRKTIK